MIQPQEAWERLVRALAPLPAIDLHLGDAVNAFLAEPVSARRDLPPCDRASMDGFAVHAEDTHSVPIALEVVGEIAAGDAADGAIAKGTCARIFTGANLPPGADAVVPVEDTSLRSFHGTADERRVTVERGAAPGNYVFKKGTVARAGDVLLPAGTRLGPRQLALCAGCGAGRVRVVRTPIVAVLVTGGELVRVETRGVDAQETPDSNGPLIVAAMRAEGWRVREAPPVPDDPSALGRALTAALRDADTVVTTGGVSAGAHDHVRAAVERAGGSVLYHGVAMKPGKPQLCATFKEGRVLFGLPGNPLSATLCLYEFVLPALRLLAGAPREACRPKLRVAVTDAVAALPDRWRFVLARLEERSTGIRARPMEHAGSADFVAAGVADGALALEPGKDLAPNQYAAFTPWSVRV